MIEIKLTLTDIPKELVFAGKKGKYIDLIVSEMKQADQYGNTHTVYIKQSKEDRQAKAEKIYVGKGKTVEFEKQPQPKAPAQKAKAEPETDGFYETQTEDDGLPF